jgi:hypothetical protein
MSLQNCLLEEPKFPIQKGRGTSIKDEVISLFLDQPGSNDECFHEEAVVMFP